MSLLNGLSPSLSLLSEPHESLSLFRGCRNLPDVQRGGWGGGGGGSYNLLFPLFYVNLPPSGSSRMSSADK